MNVIFISAIVCGAALIGYVSYLVMGPDNKVEQECEQVIKMETGTTVDLSPNTSATGATATNGPSIPALPNASITVVLAQPTATDISDAKLVEPGPTGSKS
jgi:hypothetical protein